MTVMEASGVSKGAPSAGQLGPKPSGQLGSNSKNRNSQSRDEARAGFIFLSPWLLGFVALTAGPMLASLYLSFTNYNLFNSPEFVGLENYTRLFTDSNFQQAVKVTGVYVLVGTPIKLVSALAVAMLLNNSRRGQGFYRSAFYMPSLIGGSVSIAIVWKAMFIDRGIVAQIGEFFWWAGSCSRRLGGKHLAVSTNAYPADHVAVWGTHGDLLSRPQTGTRGTV